MIANQTMSTNLLQIYITTNFNEKHKQREQYKCILSLSTLKAKLDLRKKLEENYQLNAMKCHYISLIECYRMALFLMNIYS